MTRLSHAIFSPDGVILPPRARVKRKNPEDEIHRAVLAYLRAVLPAESLVIHPANENRRSGKDGMIDRAMNKGKGVVAGVPDLIAFLPDGVTLFFEVKAPKGSVSDAQRDFLGRVQSLGFRNAVVRSVDDARAALAAWKVQTREVRL